MRASIALFTFAALACSALGCGGTVEIPRICFKQAGIAVPGSPVGGSAASPSFSIDPIDLTNQIPLLRTNSSDTDLRVDQVTITPVAGTAPDLSGIQTATMQAQPAAKEVVRYQRDPAAPPTTSIVLDGGTVNLEPYLVAGRATLSVTLTGQPPTTGWSADVETCLHATANVSP